ncbi:hypothetical protein FALCPG4_001904 [Fusarium falciforme]
MFSKYVDEHQGRMPPLIPLDESPHGANSDIEKSLDPQIREKMGSRPPQPPIYRMRQVAPSRGGRYAAPMPISMPIPIMDTESRPVAPEDENLPDKYYHLCTHVVRGFCLKAKDWGYLDIDLIQDIVWSNTAFDQLVLPHDYKRIIRAFVHAQISGLDNFDDVIKGKGRGIIMLLSGEPGTGKTLTSESVAETMHKPLYGMSAGELGDDAGEVEENLNRVLELSTKWRAVLLVDECDVFLERRSSSDLQRNKLVAIFLRLLEYYQGVMFLTTNRVSSFDPAFESRIHLTIHYPKLDVNSRLHVWNTFVKVETGGVSEAELGELAKEELNGRQIKNVVKTARLLASEEGVPLCSGHINTVLRIKRGEYQDGLSGCVGIPKDATIPAQVEFSKRYLAFQTTLQFSGIVIFQQTPGNAPDISLQHQIFNCGMDAHHAILYNYFFHAEKESKAGLEKVIDVGTAGAGPRMGCSAGRGPPNGQRRTCSVSAPGLHGHRTGLTC